MLTFLLKVCFYFSIELTVSSLSRMEGLQIKLATPNATSLSLPEDLLYFGIERHRQHKKRKANNFDKRQSLSCKTASRLECFGKRNRVKSCLCNEQCLLGYEDGLAAATTDSTLLKEKKKFYVAVFLPLPQKVGAYQELLTENLNHGSSTGSILAFRGAIVTILEIGGRFYFVGGRF